MSYIELIAEKRWDGGVSLGFEIYFHRHFSTSYNTTSFNAVGYNVAKEISSPVHFHICINFLIWFVELRIGKDIIEE